jgi:hypothetical protein
MGSYCTMMLMLMFNHYYHIAIVYDYVGMKLKHNLATQALMLKLDLLKLFTAVQPCQTI